MFPHGFYLMEEAQTAACSDDLAFTALAHKKVEAL